MDVVKAKTTMFQVNLQTIEFEGDSKTTLLSVLRTELGLNGPKFGCGQGDCGACTVLVEGKPQTSCNLPVWAVQGRQITTLEGLGTTSCPHPVQTEFIEGNAAQCGFCVSGIITAAAALLMSNPTPCRDDIVKALDKHLCRCGAHNRMISAIQRAAERMRPPFPKTL